MTSGAYKNQALYNLPKKSKITERRCINFFFLRASFFYSANCAVKLLFDWLIAVLEPLRLLKPFFVHFKLFLRKARLALFNSFFAAVPFFDFATKICENVIFTLHVLFFMCHDSRPERVILFQLCSKSNRFSAI
jgi:hypothetical protein